MAQSGRRRGGPLSSILDQYGADSVGVFAGSGTHDAAASVLIRSSCSAIGTTNLFSPLPIDGPSKPLVTALMAGQAGDAFAGVDYDHASLTVLVGTNSVVSHGQSNTVPDARRRLRLAGARRSLGDRSSSHRDSEDGDPTSPT